MIENDESEIKVFNISIGDINKFMTYNQVVEYFQDLLGNDDAYPCPVCQSNKKVIQTYVPPNPFYPVVINHQIVPDSEDESPVLFSIVVQCDNCGRLDFFSAAHLKEWLEAQNKRSQDASKS